MKTGRIQQVDIVEFADSFAYLLQFEMAVWNLILNIDHDLADFRDS